MGNCACTKDQQTQDRKYFITMKKNWTIPWLIEKIHHKTFIDFDWLEPGRGSRKNGRPAANKNNPEILSEAIDENGDGVGEMGGDVDGQDQEACENLLRPNKKISLNDFELVKVIGRGSFGKVYLVRRNGTENFYAMKKLAKAVVAKRNLFIKT